MNPTFATVIATLVLWTSIAVFAYALKERYIASGSRKQILTYLLRFIGPLVFMFLVFTLRLLIDPSSNYRFIFNGSNVMLFMFLIVGRYQYLSLLSLGDSYKAYAHYIEWVPPVFGIVMYVTIQQESAVSANIFPGLSESINTLPQTYSFLTVALLSAVIMVPLVELVFIFFQTNLVKNISWNSAPGRPLLFIHYTSILSVLTQIILVFSYLFVNTSVWRVGLVTLISIYVIQLIVCAVSINTILPLWAKSMTPKGKKDLETWERFLELLTVKRLYLSPHLKMKEISLELGVQDKELRAAISLRSENSFPVIIGLYRLNYFIGHTRIKGLKKKSIEQLAIQSGFNSRTSLHRTCTKWMKMSATDVINSGRSIDINELL